MKLIKILIIFVTMHFPVYAKYHEDKMNAESKAVVLDNINKLIKEYYISPEISEAIGKTLTI